MARRNPAFLVTCEHASNAVPPEYATLFAGHEAILESHQGYDIGARELAERLAAQLGAKLVLGTATRLLVDLNRSARNRAIFSRFTKRLSVAERQRILETHYANYRNAVKRFVSDATQAGGSVLHLSVHSFTPKMAGCVRNADVGLLYDPSRVRERAICYDLQTALRAAQPRPRVRRNYPYRGTTDGMATALRREFPDTCYVGIELEMNQRSILGENARQVIDIVSHEIKLLF